MNTYLSDELQLVEEKEPLRLLMDMIHSITWISTDLGRSIDIDGFIWNNAIKSYPSESLSLLNDSVDLPKSTAPLNEPEFVWLLE